MAERSKPPSEEDWEALLKPDSRNEAIEARRGYDWQAWLTVEHWLALAADEAIWVEWGEDLTRANAKFAQAIQAKDLSSKISLGRKRIQEIISRGLERGVGVTTIIWTRAAVGNERGAAFGGPGITYWRRVTSGDADAGPLVAYLLAARNISLAAVAMLRAVAPGDAASLLARVQWVVEEPDITNLQKRVELRLAKVLKDELNLPLPSSRAEPLAMHLFAVVAAIGSRRKLDDRKLTRKALEEVIGAFNAKLFIASLADAQLAAAGEVKRRGTEATVGETIVQAPGAPPVNAPRDPRLDLTPTLELSLRGRYERAMRQSLFQEFAGRNLFAGMAGDALSADYVLVDPALRRRVLLRAARATAMMDKSVEEAERLLAEAGRLRGDDSDRLARARIAQTRGDIDEALRLVRDETSADARSVVLAILTAAGRDADALAFLAEHKVEPDMLTEAGAYVLAQVRLRREDHDGFIELLNRVSEAQCRDGPQLLLWRGIARFASIFPAADRQMALRGIPTGVRFADPSAAPPEVAERLDRAIADFDRVAALEADLDLNVSARSAERYRRWCELMHPHRRDAAMMRLKAELADPLTAPQVLQFAFAFDVPFDEAPLQEALTRRERMGGLNEEELGASFILALRSEDPARIAAFINSRREPLERTFDKAALAAVEIQALIEAGEIESAKTLFGQMPEGGLDVRRIQLEADIVKAEGGDPSEVYRVAFDRDDTDRSLRAYVNALGEKGDRAAVIEHGKALFARSKDLGDLAKVARAMASVGNEAPLVEFLDAYPEITERDPELRRHYAGVLYKLGRLDRATEVVAKIAEGGASERLLDLEMAIAVESGAWENLAVITAAHLADGRKREGGALIQAAIAAQVAGVGRMMELADAAVAAAPNDPGVLMGAYMIVTEEGLEEKRPEAQNWFKRAIVLSGEEGPLRQVEIKDLLAMQGDWRERTGKINTSLERAELPLAIAAKGLNTTVIDLVARNFARNERLLDPRQRAALPLFAGHREPRRTGEAKLAAFDLSSLMTLGWLGLLPKALALFPNVLIPAGLMSELFEGRQRIRRTQKSRIANAQQVRDAIAVGRIKVRPAAAIDPEAPIDVDLAAMLAAAAEAGGVVVRPAPVHPPGSLDAEVDMTAHAAVLTDMFGLLDGLVDAGAVTASEEDAARAFFQLQDRRWPAPARLDPSKPVFLDELALSYLQTAGLLNIVLDTCAIVWVEHDAGQQANDLLDQDADAARVLDLIQNVRASLRNAVASGRASFGSARNNREDIKINSSTVNMLHDLRKAELLIVDDRAMNKEAFAQDGLGHNAPVLSTLDVLEELLARKEIWEADWRNARHKLRVSGASLVPAVAEEVAQAAVRTKQAESAELRAIRESIELPRMAETIRFPPEAIWFAMISIAIKNAIKLVWLRETDYVRAAVLSDTLLEMMPRAHNWHSCWIEGAAPGGWAYLSDVTMIASLVLPVELNGHAALEPYTNWLEDNVLESLRNDEPLRYDAVVAQTREFVLTAGDGDDDTE